MRRVLLMITTVAMFALASCNANAVAYAQDEPATPTVSGSKL